MGLWASRDSVRFVGPTGLRGRNTRRARGPPRRAGRGQAPAAGCCRRTTVGPCHVAARRPRCHGSPVHGHGPACAFARAMPGADCVEHAVPHG